MKGIIVAAGYGTRFLPVTKTIPKEMLPLINKPSIQFIVDEFIESGIRDIIIISSRRKKSMEDYFDREIELESVFKNEGNSEKLSLIEPTPAKISFVRQREMKGTGHALLQVKELVGDSPVVIAYPDDLHFGKVPLAKQMIDVWEKTSCSVMATIHNPPNLNRYGILDIAPDGLHVTNIVEKPPLGQEPSKEVSIGRFLLSPEFFDYLEEGWEKHTGGEYYHVYGLKKLMDKGSVVFKEVEGERLDTGEPAGFLRATLKYALKDPQLRKVIEEEMKADSLQS